VDQKTEKSEIEEAFTQFTSERKDIGILLINQHVRYITRLLWRETDHRDRLQSRFETRSTDSRKLSPPF
jgi:vacuolar-type H+-ATPase subunit F/Vma7